ncbi:hypothetical protein GCM10020229_74780 [Kitasatospora albolonga]
MNLRIAFTACSLDPAGELKVRQLTYSAPGRPIDEIATGAFGGMGARGGAFNSAPAPGARELSATRAFPLADSPLHTVRNHPLTHP